MDVVKNSVKDAKLAQAFNKSFAAKIQSKMTFKMLSKEVNKDIVADLKTSIAPGSMEDLKLKLRDMILNPALLNTNLFINKKIP